MDPITLMMLGSAGIGLGKEVISALPSQAGKRNKEELERLLEMEKRNKLGLTEQERGAVREAAVLPAKQQAAETRRQSAAMQATMGNRSAGDVAQLRSAEQQQAAGAEQEARQRVAELDIARVAEQRREIEQRLLSKEARRRDTEAGVFGALSQAAMAGGQAAALQGVGLLDKPLPDTSQVRAQLEELGFQGEALDLVEELARTGKLAEVIREARALQAGG